MLTCNRCGTAIKYPLDHKESECAALTAAGVAPTST